VVVDANSNRSGRPADQVDRRKQLDRREQVDAYKQILNPTAPPRRSRMVAGGALGLALLGVARMIWRAAPNPRPEATPVRSDTRSRFRQDLRKDAN
jgi:hypothetical protein